MTPFTFYEVQKALFPFYTSSRAHDTAIAWNRSEMKKWNALLPELQEVYTVSTTGQTSRLSRGTLITLIHCGQVSGVVWEDRDGDLFAADGQLFSIKRGNVMRNPSKYHALDEQRTPEEIAAVGYHG